MQSGPYCSMSVKSADTRGTRAGFMGFMRQAMPPKCLRPKKMASAKI